MDCPHSIKSVLPQYYHRLHRLRNRDWTRPYSLACTHTSSVIPSTAATSNSHPDAFIILSGTSAVLCNVLTPSTEVWRAKSTLFLLPSPVARSVSVTGSAVLRICNPGYVAYDSMLYPMWLSRTTGIQRSEGLGSRLPAELMNEQSWGGGGGGGGGHIRQRPTHLAFRRRCLSWSHLTSSRPLTAAVWGSSLIGLLYTRVFYGNTWVNKFCGGSIPYLFLAPTWSLLNIFGVIVERIHARNQTNCAFCDKSMKLGTWFLDVIRSILRNGAISDLTFGDL